MKTSFVRALIVPVLVTGLVVAARAQVENVTGTRKLAARKHLGRVTWSPDSKYALFFNGKDWITLSVPDGKTTNLTATLSVKFWTEDHDSPGSPGSYGTAV